MRSDKPQIFNWKLTIILLKMKRINLLLGFAFFLSLTVFGKNENGSMEGEESAPAARTVVKQLPPVRVVCVGNSITEGYGNTSQEKAWPAQTNKLLGNGYAVLNCGVSGTTMFKNSEVPYWATQNFKRAKEANPQILLIALGTNDAHPSRWNKLKQEFKSDYLAMVNEFRQGGKDPVIYVCLPPPLFGPAKADQNKVVEEELIPLLKQIAKEIGAQVIDYHQPLLGANKEFPDDVHPDDSGAALMAEIAFQKIKEMQVIQPHLSVNKGEEKKESIAIVEKGGTVTLDPLPKNGSWRWEGPDGVTFNERVLKLENIKQGGIYTAIYTNEAGYRSVANYLVSVKGEEGPILISSVRDMEGKWLRSKFIRVNPGGTITLDVQADAVGELSWSWIGPNGFFAGTRDVTLSPVMVNQGGEYTASCTDRYGRQRSTTFTVKVEGEVVCPDLVSYLNNGSGWQQVTEMELKAGDNVTFGPHPMNGNWHWEGPAGFTSDRRDASVLNFSEEKAGKYVGTFTNVAGCRLELVVTLKLKK